MSMQGGSLFNQFFPRAFWLSDGFYSSPWLLRHFLAMLSKQRGFLHFAESYRCRGFCMMSEGSATNAFLKGNVYEIQCRLLLKLSQPYFPRFRWPLDPGSPSPTWQSYITSDFFYIMIAFFFLSCYHVPTHNVLNTAKGIFQASKWLPDLGQADTGTVLDCSHSASLPAETGLQSDS